MSRYVRLAADLGFTTLAANDHLVFPAPWLDGLTALASVVGESGTMRLATTVALPVVRGPVPLAKALGTLDRLSGGRVIAGVGPGSAAGDHEAVGIAFEERWARLEESVHSLRALWAPDGEPYTGRFYSTAGARLTPPPGRDPAGFPNALATMWCHITDDAGEADDVLRRRLLPVVHRPEDVLRERLPIGPAGAVVEKLLALCDAGVQQVLVWPVVDEERQLERLRADVWPHVAA